MHIINDLDKKAGDHGRLELLEPDIFAAAAITPAMYKAETDRASCQENDMQCSLAQ